MPVDTPTSPSTSATSDGGDVSPPEPTIPRLPPGRPLLRDALPVALLVCVIMFTGVALMRANSRFSRLDELEHFTYVTNLVDQHAIPRKGDLYTQQAIRAEACWGYQIGGTKLPPCTSPALDPHDFGNHGVTTAAGYPPVYYVATAAVAVPLKIVFGFDSLFIPARLASLLWLTLGALATYFLARTLRVRRLVATSVALTAALLPLMLTQGTTVNPDAMSLLAGAGTALAWLRLRAVPRVWPFLGLVAALTAVALIKANFLAVPIAVVLAEVALVARGGLRGLFLPGTWSPQRPLMRVVAAAGLAEALGVLWSFLMIINDRPSVPLGPSGSPPGTSPWDPDLLLRHAPTSFAPLGGNPFFVHVLDRGAMFLLSSIGNSLVTAGAIAAVLVANRRRVGDVADIDMGDGRAEEAWRAVGYLAAASIVVAAPMLAVITGVAGAFVAYPARYSLFIVPLGLAGLAGLAGRRRTLIFVPLAMAVVGANWHYLGAFRWH